MPPLWPLVLGTVLLRYKANSGPRETCTVLLSLHQAVNVARQSMAWWGKFTHKLQWGEKDQTEMKILSDLILIINHLLGLVHLSGRLTGTWFTKFIILLKKLIFREETSRKKLKTLERERLWCTELPIPATNPPLPGVRCLWILSPGNRVIKGTSFPIFCCPFKLPFSIAHQK